MKNIYFVAIMLIVCLHTTAFAQIKTVNQITNVFSDYESDFDKQVAEGKNKKQKEKLAYNPKMLNMFIADNISTYLSSSKDISLQKYYAILESEDGSLFIGYNITCRKSKLDRLTNVFNIGLKTNTENNFSNLLVDDKLNPELSLNIKYTHILKGKIKYGNHQKAIVENYRSNYLKSKYEDAVKKYSDTDPDRNKDSNTELEAKLKVMTNLTQKEKEEMINEEYQTQYEAIASDEEKFITDNKMFNSIVSNWTTFESNIPFTKKKYNISPATTIFTTDEKRFYNFNIALALTRMQKWSNKMTIYTTVSLNAFNNNNILTNKLKAYKFETVADQGGNNQTVADTKDAYVGTYASDFSQSIKAELVWFFIKDITGVSFSGEAVIGDLSARNWKMAIPFSLKDKEGKPSINFELQYKEVYKKHQLGISVGYAFGKYFN